MYFRTMMIMAFHNFLSLGLLNKYCLFFISPKLCMPIHLCKLARHVIRCLPLSLPSSIKFSKLSFLIMGPRNFSSLFLMLSIILIAKIIITIIVQQKYSKLSQIHRAVHPNNCKSTLLPVDLLRAVLFTVYAFIYI